MIKIIEPGTRRIIKCTECGCEFSFDEDDIKGYKLYVVDPLAVREPYIECPQCGKEIILKSMI